LGEIPDHDELQEVMSSSGAQYTAWQAAWLKALVCSIEQDDPTSSSSSSSGNDLDLPVPDMLPPANYSSWYGEPAAGSTAAAAAAAAGPRVPFEELGINEERLWGAIGECTMLMGSAQLLCITFRSCASAFMSSCAHQTPTATIIS
jgi:hypothetical protein